MDELYGDWKAIAAPEKTCHSTKGLRTEVLWVNYDIDNTSKSNLNKGSSKLVETECQPQQLSLMSALERVINNLNQSVIQDNAISTAA
ncbi:D12 class N6 adenine-specific DNA methyltransferase [Calothrix sp. NIES-4071]|nr:D12 class N6 adenine-specific DNA methyltransferase [Calothrix sp. NIES-4071]BAZ60159.1 D12 class N6 adenine-specific DNA methyltransferase [Calothrix sp. NIES-4105]